MPTTTDLPHADPIAELTEAPKPEPVKLDDPEDLLSGQPMPTRKHTITLPSGETKTVLLQGLPYLQKQEIDSMVRAAAAEALKDGEEKPSLLYPWLLARALRRANGARAYPKKEHWQGKATALAEQLQDAEIHRAATVVLELSGWGKKAEDDAGKASGRTPTAS